DTGHVVASHLDLAGVQTRADLNLQRLDGVSDGARAANGPSRPVEGGDKAIAGGVHFTAAEPLKLAAHNPVVAVEKFTPSAVPQCGRSFGGGDDVGVQHRGQDPVSVVRVADAGQEVLDLTDRCLGITYEHQVVLTGKLDEFRLRDVLGEIFGVRLDAAQVAV